MASELVAEMVANVWKLVAEPGQRLQAGDTVLILESMKMEIPVLVEAPGTLTEMRVREGYVVQEGDILAVIT